MHPTYPFASVMPKMIAPPFPFAIAAMSVEKSRRTWSEGVSLSSTRASSLCSTSLLRSSKLRAIKGLVFETTPRGYKAACRVVIVAGSQSRIWIRGSTGRQIGRPRGGAVLPTGRRRLSRCAANESKSRCLIARLSRWNNRDAGGRRSARTRFRGPSRRNAAALLAEGFIYRLCPKGGDRHDRSLGALHTALHGSRILQH